MKRLFLLLLGLVAGMALDALIEHKPSDPRQTEIAQIRREIHQATDDLVEAQRTVAAVEAENKAIADQIHFLQTNPNN